MSSSRMASASARVHEARIDGHRLAGEIRSLEGDVLQHPLEDRVEAPRPDVLGALVRPAVAISATASHRVRREVERHALGPRGPCIA